MNSILLFVHLSKFYAHTNDEIEIECLTENCILCNNFSLLYMRMWVNVLQIKNLCIHFSSAYMHGILWNAFNEKCN